MTRLPDLHAVRRVLIIRLSSIGDVVHALPVSAALGEAFPHLELTWIVEESAAEVVSGNPYLHEVIVVPRERWKRGRKSPAIWREYLGFLRMLRKRRFEVSLDLQGYAKSGMMAGAAGAKYRFGWWNLHDIAGLVSHPLPHRAESVHRVDWFLDVVRAFGVEPKSVQFPIFLPPESFVQARELLCQGGLRPDSPFVVVNPATGDKLRRWGTEPYAQVIRLLAEREGLPTVLIGSGRDRPLCEQIIRRVAETPLPSGVPAPLLLAGQTNLKTLSALLKMASVQVCSDTGSAHIAAAVGCPTVSVYGPSDPAHAGPWGQEANVLSGRSLCQPGCNLHTQCCAFPLPPETANGSLSAAHCLRSITPESVAEKVEQIIHHPLR